MRRTALPTVLILSAVLALGACTSETDKPTDEDTTTAATQPTESSTSTPLAEDSSEDSADEEKPAPREDSPVATRKLPGTRDDLDLELFAVRDTGSLATISVRLTNPGEHSVNVGDYITAKDQSIPGTDETETLLTYTTRDFYLVDNTNKKIHRTAFDTSKRCLCSDVYQENLAPGSQTELYASVAPLPEGVETVSVSIPNVGVIDDVPVVRGN